MPRRRWRFGKALCFTIEQRTGILAIDREIDVLGGRPGSFDEAQSVKLGDHNSGHRAARGLPLFPGCTGAVTCN